MSCVITLDVGTTNTRALLWRDGKKLISERKSETGAAFTAADGNNNRLKAAVRDCINRLLGDGGICEQDVECVLASGMVTSNVGLYEVPHLTAPVGLSDLAAGVRRVSLPDVSPIPFWMIPGMKNRVESITPDNFESMDMMRGEEVEAVALLEEIPAGASCLIILPGSHTKFVAVEEGKLTACLTTLTGELLSALSLQTILADTVERRFTKPETYHGDMLKLGYRIAQKSGLARAAFAARVLKQQAGYSAEQMASYLLGAVLEQDIRAVRNSNALHVDKDTHILISGKDVFCRAFSDVMALQDDFKHVSVFEPKEQRLSAMGALKIYQAVKSVTSLKEEQ